MSNNTAAIMQFPEKSPYKPETAKAFINTFDGFNSINPASKEILRIRAKGISQLELQGLPLKKLERWKYTDLSPALRKEYTIAPLAPETNHQLPICECPDLIDQDFPDQDIDGQLWALNQAFLNNPYQVEIPEGAEATLDLLWQGKGVDIFHTPRTIIRIKKGAHLTLNEIIKAPDGCWLNPCMQIILDAGASCHHHRDQECEAKAFCTYMTYIKQEEDSSYIHYALSSGAQIGRSQFHADLEGPHSKCRTNGISLLDGQRINDMTINIRHKAENCFSTQNLKSVLMDQSRGVFQGTIQVNKEAQKTDAHQLSKAIILSEGAEMDTRPELEIFADDVKCSHGATVGQIDDEALFYLRSRGIPAKKAKHLLISGFLNEVVEDIQDEDAKKLFAGRVDQWLEQIGDDF